MLDNGWVGDIQLALFSMCHGPIPRLLREYTPSVESTIVPSKSESIPSKVTVCAGAEKDSIAEGDMAGW